MMTDYEHTLTVAIKAISELIEDNRELRATIETLRGSKDCPKSNQGYEINIGHLADALSGAPSNASDESVALYLATVADEFITMGGN